MLSNCLAIFFILIASLIELHSDFWNEGGAGQMNELIKEYMNAYSVELKELYFALRELIYSSISQKQEIEEKLWAKLPSYYVGNFFVRLIPFKDHINEEK